VKHKSLQIFATLYPALMTTLSTPPFKNSLNT